MSSLLCGHGWLPLEGTKNAIHGMINRSAVDLGIVTQSNVVLLLTVCLVSLLYVKQACTFNQ
jgi:hypothetical protein